ncbi:MAG TPA: hypothetical protein DCR97_07815 [Deltaproteobacteria bacterium]|nr:hypothetical protein [Deltaproteobacteria bacterium]
MVMDPSGSIAFPVQNLWNYPADFHYIARNQVYGAVSAKFGEHFLPPMQTRQHQLGYWMIQIVLKIILPLSDYTCISMKSVCQGSAQHGEEF